MHKTTLLFLLISLILLEGCSAIKDTSYLTPIPAATWQSYREGAPVTSRLEAVIASRSDLLFHLVSTSEPLPIYAEKLRYEAARNLVTNTKGIYTADRPRDMIIWLVVWEGDWQIIPPPDLSGHTTLRPLEGCVFVILNPADGTTIEVGNGSCIH